ncbi:ubiquitin-like domain-containing protein (plasmid) [Radiobacillus kanasensis]|uniref:G5 and 3D domain-containing protein n=1 Tax=Radiobacillus kanasensis TaxID=2844358 RepID=UPI001E63BF92|nr:G5 and 3D domain-containing protein [Radiobacillus kanasensis]UFU01511.1 ubiquitin-like domain-containing protein [Radiobacillus kanasensis]
MNPISKLLPAWKHKLVIPMATILAALVLVSMITYQVTKAEVTVVKNGDEEIVNTHADTVAELLQELNINPSKYDTLSHKQQETITAGMTIMYEKAQPVEVTLNGKTTEYYTTADTVGAFLQENEIAISEHDKLSVAQEDEIKNGMNISIDQAFQITLTDAGKEQKVWTTGGTVADLLKGHDIKLGELDKLNVKETDKVNKDTVVKITRVEKVTDVVEETKDYAVVKKQDSSLAKGQEKVISSGEEGIVEKHYEVILENGKEVSRKLVKEQVKKESEKRVVAIGTKVNQNTGVNTVSRGDAPAGKTFYMKATAYNWNCASCSGSGYTSTGINLKANPDRKVVSVDPNVIPLGTKVWVEGYGYAIAGDTGGHIQGNRIDVHLPTLSAAQSYGTRRVQVKILN